MPTSFYDVVVLGTRLEPLLCAALLGREGLRVLVLGQGEPDASYTLDDVAIEPYPFPIVGVQSPAVQRALELLALQQDVRQRMVDQADGFQLLLPEYRIRVFRDRQLWLGEIERELPGIARQAIDISRTLGEVDAEFDAVLGRDLSWPPETFLERQQLSFASSTLRYDRQGVGWTSWNQLAHGHPLRAGFEALLPHVSGLLAAQHSDATRARLQAQVLDGVSSLAGGWTWFREALSSRIRSWGGEVRPNERASTIRPVGRRGHVVTLGGTGEEIGCTQLVHGTPIGQLAQLLPDRDPVAGLFERVGEPRSRAYRCSVHLLIDEQGAPEALGPLALYGRDVATPERAFFVRSESVGAQRLLVSATTLIDEHLVDTASSPLRFVRRDAMTAIRELMPFVDEHAIWIDSPHDGLAPECLRGGRELVNSEPWVRGPSTMQAIYEYPTRRALGVCALPTRTPVRGVFLCNEQVAPGLGFEGSFLASMSVARMIASQYRRQDWLRRGPWARRSV